MSDPNRQNALGQKAEPIPMRFILPGLVRYADVGDVLVRKETLDRMAATFIGKPIFNETHKEVTNKDFTSGRADGVITGVRFNSEDGWFWADSMVWDPETKENCRNGHSVSCAYDVLKWSDKGGINNNIPYEREVLDGEYTHMAVVNNPRYEGARVIYNTQGGSMKLAFWRKDKEKPEVQNSSEVETDSATLTIDGSEVPLKEAIELWNSNKAKKSEELKNAKLSDDDEMEVGGERVTVKNLKDAYVTARKNAEDKEKEKKENAKNSDMKKGDCPKCEGSGDVDGKKCGKCDGTGVYYTTANEDDEKKKEEKEKENARKNAEEKEKKEKEDEERKNQAYKNKLRNTAYERNGTFEPPNLLTKEDRIKEGVSRYGSK